MTKAEKIFKDTYQECRIHARKHGFERNPDGTAIGYSNLFTDEATSRRTWNAIQKLIDIEKRNSEMMKKYGVRTEEDNIYDFALEMVQTTLNNTIKDAERWA